jgi:hypothetical protein
VRSAELRGGEASFFSMDLKTSRVRFTVDIQDALNTKYNALITRKSVIFG